jgi:hypothetical protein
LKIIFLRFVTFFKFRFETLFNYENASSIYPAKHTSRIFLKTCLYVFVNSFNCKYVYRNSSVINLIYSDKQVIGKDPINLWPVL